MKIAIELDVYSGRPNPAWVLEKEDAERLARSLQNLKPCKTLAHRDGLGYRGFILSLDNGAEIKVFQVYAGFVLAKGNRANVLADDNHIEQALLQMAKEKGYTNLLKDLGVK